MTTTEIVSRDPEVMNGELVFAGTRVPVQSLVDYLKSGDTLGTFLDDFPTVARERAEGFLQRSVEEITWAEKRQVRHNKRKGGMTEKKTKLEPSRKRSKALKGITRRAREHADQLADARPGETPRSFSDSAEIIRADRDSRV